MPTKRVYVEIGADDGQFEDQSGAGGENFSSSGTSVRAGSTADRLWGFYMRFAPALPDGTNITAATFGFQNLGTGTGTPEIRVSLYDSDDPAAPTSYSEAKGATLTTAGVTTNGNQTAGIFTFDITSAMSEVYGRPGFSPTSHIVADVRTTKGFISADGYIVVGAFEGSHFGYVDITYDVAPEIVGPEIAYGPLGRAGTDAPAGVLFQLIDDIQTGTDELSWEIRTAADGIGTVVTSGTATTNEIVNAEITTTSPGIVAGANVLYLRANDGTYFSEVPFVLMVQQANVQSSGLVRAASRGYEVLLRNMRSGQIVQWLPEFKSLSYKRSARGIGEWTLQLSHTQIDGSLLSSGTMLEIHREGWLEMAGPIVQPFDYDDANDRLTVTGRDMKYLLLARLTSLVEADAVDGVTGETAMRHYVGTWAVPQWNDWFGNHGAEMSLQTIDQQRGGIVAHSAVGQTVLSICSTLALRSGLWFDVVFDANLSTYRFEVYEITDAGAGTVFPWTFSTKLENVENMRYSRTETPTIMYGLGPVDQITGVRTVETATRVSLEDAVPSIPREAFVDLRYAGGSALPSQTLANLLEETERAEQVVVTPNHRSIAQYREPQGWDLGYRVGADIHRIGQYTERLVQEVQVTISGDGPEKMEITLGDPTVDLLDLLDMYFERTVAAQTG